MTKKDLAKKYRKLLAPFQEENKSFQDQWLALLTDLINESESRWDYNSIRYQTVMTKKEWQNFVSHPERKPYQSKTSLPKDDDRKFKLIIEILKDSYQYYKTLKKSRFKDNLKSSMATLLDCALNAKYEIETMRMADEYYGRKASDRDNGKIDPTPVSLSKLNYAIREYCQTSKRNLKELQKKIYQLSKGRVSILREYFYNYDIDKNLRNALLEIFKILKRDQTLAFADIKRGWQIWKTIREIGLDLDHYLELNGMPKYSIIKKKLLEFQRNKSLVKEVLNHMKDELPESYQKYQKQGFIARSDLVAEEAKRKQYPKKMRTEKQIRKMIADCKKEVWQYFPLAKKSSPRNILLNPIHPASTSRAFQSSTRNVNGKRVNVIVMTPRSIQKDLYLPVLAHETTHAIHRMILEAGESSGILSPGSAERIPHNIMEEFSQLVEHLFYQDKDLPYQKKFHGKEFPNFHSATAIRFQVPFALVQLGIRKKFDQWWNSGYREELSESAIWQLKQEFDQKVKKWTTIGIKIIYETLTAFDLFVSYGPTDGLRYMKRYLTKGEPKTSRTKKQNHCFLADAFRERFGQNWIKSKEARTIFLWLLLESGRNHRLEEFSRLILEKEVETCLEELKKIGISKKDI